MPNLLELQDLYNESLVRETIEKTKSCGITWNNLGGTQFQSTEVDASVSPNITWNFFITKTQIGNATYKYTFDVKKNAISYLTINDGPLPYTDRDSVVKQLYEIVEIIVFQLDQKLKETIRFMQQITDCRS